MARLFFSLKFSSGQQQQLLPYQQQALSLCPQAKVVVSDNLHLTLFFVGEADAQQQQRLIAAAARINSPAFALTLDQLACFAKPKIIYLAPSQIPAHLTALQQQVAALCKTEGFNDIHSHYQPHVTLVRHASYDDSVEVTPLSFTITEFALYQSAQLDDRLHYRPLQRFSLI